MFGVIDCNNFFVSCERVFHPDLHEKPVVVLSNNDGCVISRSNEAKKMGLAMGVPFFQVKSLMENGRLFVRSSNYTLYGDMSRRVMAVIRLTFPKMEVYSIDEAFVDFSGFPQPHQTGLELARKIKKWTGIPVSVGIAETKTLAKAATKFAKKYPSYHSCCIIDSEEKRLKAIQLLPIEDVWGIGRKMRSRVGPGVHTAYDFTQWNRRHVQQEFGISGVRTWMELSGIPCVPFEPGTPKQTITTSRSFKQYIKTMDELKPIVSDLAAHCAKKLRRQSSYAKELLVFIHTNRFNGDSQQYANAAKIVFEVPTNDVRELAKASAQALEKIFLDGIGYKQAGVIVSHICNGIIETSAFDPVNRVKQQHLLKTVDHIHSLFGDSALKVASQGDCSNAMNRQYASANYTTNARDIITVKTD